MDKQWDRFFAFVLRDSLIILLTVALWMVTLKLGQAHNLPSAAMHVATALLTVLVAYLLHEWGHLIGAWISGAAFELPARVTESPFLFRFDTGRSSRAQFLQMSLGGFTSSLLTVVFLAVALPRDMLASWIALGLTAVGVVATLITEVPMFVGVWRGGPMPTGAVFISAVAPPGRQDSAGSA
jgi:hypothetical protein